MNEVIVKKKNDLVVSEEDVRTIDYLSNGYTISEASKWLCVNKRTLEARINRLRVHFQCVNVTQLTCEFIRKGLIK